MIVKTPIQFKVRYVSVKEMTLGASIPLTTQGHKVNGTVDQALVGAIKPNLISDLIQRGALR